MKQIHFYTDLCNEEQTSEWDLDTMNTDFVSTVREIEKVTKEGRGIVKTTQLSLLHNTWDYIDEGFDVFIHIREENMNVSEHMRTPSGKDIRRGQDLSRLLLGGTFGKIYPGQQI